MIAVVFPGQGAQTPGMGKSLVEAFPVAAQVFDEVSEATHLDLRALCFESDEPTLRLTQNAQIALYTVSLAAFRAFQSKAGPSLLPLIKCSAGHSVGEYAALAAAEFVSLSTGAKLVQARGTLMAESGNSNPGTMAAVLGLSREVLDKLCDSVEGVVVVANDNCPGQLVISGEVDAVEAAGKMAMADGAKRVLPLNVSGAFHSPLMVEPAVKMGEILRDATWQKGTLPVYANVCAEPISDSAEWADLLQRQLSQSVRWTESVEHMRRDGVTTFIELGVGEVLSGLIRRIDREAVSYRVSDSQNLSSTLESLNF